VGGGTNFWPGFEFAFEMLTTSRTWGYSSLCQPIILFVTDGVPDTQYLSGQALINSIASNNTYNATIFTYSLGSDATDDTPRLIACTNRGVWSEIEDGGDLDGQMSSYDDFFAALRRGQPNVVWVGPYLDTAGAGMLATASVAVYDETVVPPVIIGVASISVLYSSLYAIEPDNGVISQLLASRNTCPTFTFNECQLESFRAVPDSSGTYPRNCSNILGTPSCPSPISTSCNGVPLNGQPFCALQNPSSYNYATQSCCPGCTSNNNIAIGVAVGISILVLLLIVIAVVVYIRNRALVRDLELYPSPAVRGNPQEDPWSEDLSVNG